MPKWDDDDELTLPEEPPKAVHLPSTASAAPPAVRAAEVPAAEQSAPAPQAAESSAAPPKEGWKHRSEQVTIPVQAQPTDGSGIIVEKADSAGRREEFANVSTRIGVLGGKGVGKSYYFQALVHTLIHSAGAGKRGKGVMSRYIRGRPPEIWHSLAMREEKPSLIDTAILGAQYRRWERLPSTTRENQRWYKLRMQFQTGLLARTPWRLDVDFLDGSGEALEIGLAVKAMEPLWKRAFGQATIMVFCLPLWALFPDRNTMTPEDIRERERVLTGFGSLVNTYKQVRQSDRVQTFLALTMADDRRGSLEALRRRWIEPCTGKNRRTLLEKLSGLAGVPRYLASARQVSNYLYEEIEYSEDTRVREIPGKITFDHPPWLVPVSAIDGSMLEAKPADRFEGEAHLLQEPRPAHVELPLLAAMCDCQNALM